MNTDLGTLDLTPYRVFSRREIISLLRSIRDRNQLVSMMISGGAEAVVTSVLDIDEEQNLVVVDCAPSNMLNEKILSSKRINFETVLDQIRILFHTEEIDRCTYDGLPALCFPIPESLIRLQRREFYRVATPVANPVRCMIPVPDEDGENIVIVTTTLQNISAGGIAIVDEKKLLDNTIGVVYKDCKLDLPGAPPITITLQIRNSQDLTLTSGKAIRRIGCMFVNLPQAQLASVQRYITKLERERNARMTGMR